MTKTDYEFHSIVDDTENRLVAQLVVLSAPKSVTAKLTINNKTVSYRAGGSGHNRYRAAIAGVAYDFKAKHANAEHMAVTSEQLKVLDILEVEASHQLTQLQLNGFNYETAF